MELTEIRNKRGYICDMDGVIYHGNRLLPGVSEFVEWLQNENKLAYHPHYVLDGVGDIPLIPAS